MPQTANRRKNKKRKKDQPYKNGVKKNDETQSDVSTIQKVNKCYKKSKFLNSLNSKNSGSDNDTVLIFWFFFIKEKEQDNGVKKRHNGKFRFFAHDMVINNLQMQMSQNKNQMTHCGI